MPCIGAVGVMKKGYQNMITRRNFNTVAASIVPIVSIIPSVPIIKEEKTLKHEEPHTHGQSWLVVDHIANKGYKYGKWFIHAHWECEEVEVCYSWCCIFNQEEDLEEVLRLSTRCGYLAL